MLTSTVLGEAFAAARPDLVSFLTRMVVRPEVAEELAQEAALRLVTAQNGVADVRAVRPWLFRVGARLAIDHLRSHASRHERPLQIARARANADPEFSAESRRMIGDPAMRLIAKEHLSACLSCTLRNLKPEVAASMLLVEVYGFTLAQAADMLDATPAQTKHWVASGRVRLKAIYASTCALVAKSGVCYQCTELDELFNGTAKDPLDGTDRGIGARFDVMRALGTNPPSRWHQLMLRLIDDVLSFGGGSLPQRRGSGGSRPGCQDVP